MAPAGRKGNVEHMANAFTVDEVAEQAGADPADVLALAGMYPDDEEGIWEEEGVLSPDVSEDIWMVLNSQCERTIPELYPSK
jgi:hypothetical protein